MFKDPCPHCGEMLKADATFCTVCDERSTRTERLAERDRQASEGVSPDEVEVFHAPETKGARNMMILLAVMAVVGAVEAHFRIRPMFEADVAKTRQNIRQLETQVRASRELDASSGDWNLGRSTADLTKELRGHRDELRSVQRAASSLAPIQMGLALLLVLGAIMTWFRPFLGILITVSLALLLIIGGTIYSPVSIINGLYVKIGVLLLGPASLRSAWRLEQFREQQER